MSRFGVIAAASLAAFATIGMLHISPASAETATASMEIIERGPLYRQSFKPVDVHLKVNVIPEPGATTISELANTKLNLPRDLTFSTQGTKVCVNDIGQINPENANRPTAEVVAECPNSVVGEGTAVINVAGLLAAEISDPKLTVFNGGVDQAGDPILLVHAFSPTVVPGGYGIPLRGALKDGVLDVYVPPLAANSAVTEFTFDLPGSVGQDPSYSRAKCSSGTWVGDAVLTLHDFDLNTGIYINETQVQTEDSVQTCTGLPGKARFGSVKVKGPKSVKKGKKGTYKVTVKNTGTAIAKGVKIAASGKGASGKASGGNIAPGASKTISVKVKFSKKGRFKVKLRASAKGVAANVGRIAIAVG